jgi:hypothetical protein
LKSSLNCCYFIILLGRFVVKVTRSYINRIIQEELDKLLNEEMTSQERAAMIAKRNRAMGLDTGQEDEEILSQVFQNAPAAGVQGFPSGVQRFVDKQGPDGETGRSRGMKTGLDLARSPRTAPGQRTGATRDREIMQKRAMQQDVGQALNKRIKKKSADHKAHMANLARVQKQSEKEIARQDAPYISGKKWEMKKDWRGRPIADLSQVPTRRKAWRAAHRARLPSFKYKGKDYTTRYAQGGRKVKASGRLAQRKKIGRDFGAEAAMARGGLREFIEQEIQNLLKKKSLK